MKIIYSLIFLIFILYYFITVTSAQENNSQCPNQEICKSIEETYLLCKRGNQFKCEEFISWFKVSLYQYNCHEKNSLLKENTSLALHACKNKNSYLEHLSNMKSTNAKKLYGSSLLRRSLFKSAEKHRNHSIQVEKVFLKK